YTLTLNDDGSLQIQAPTLIRPLSIEARQVQDLQQWLNDLQPGNVPQGSTGHVASAGVTDSAAPGITEAMSPTPEVADEPPETVAQRIIQQIVSNTSANYPETLAPENRDRFIEQVTRNATIRPLMSQGKITYKQVTLWVEHQLGTGLY
ncbi:MAG: hypothetical protein H0U76_28690, partial [Ktedonobacteraceae bacterium]|nr:hypothetical protein [Ktedonobacteraceae bacterium]